MDYYPVEFQIHEKVYFVIWQGNDNNISDSFLCINKRIINFIDYQSCLDYCSDNNLAIKTELPPAKYNFDLIVMWLKNPTLESIDSNRFLDIWNIIGDISQCSPDLKKIFLEKQEKQIRLHHELFRGTEGYQISSNKEPQCNLNKDDLQGIIEIMEFGIGVVSSFIRCHN